MDPLPITRHPIGPPVPNFNPSLTILEQSALMAAFNGGWISSKGPSVVEFEQLLACHLGRRYACAVSSGTAALHLALKSLGVGSGDEVVVPGLTYIAVANAVIYCGAVPVIADVDPGYWSLDPVSLAGALGPRTKAVVAVHGFGHPADMDAIRRIADRQGIPVIEDISQAFGAECRGALVGSQGRIGISSFFANKIVTTGEGGALLTDDPEVQARAESLRNHCESPARKYLHESVGFNYRMSNLQAAIGCAQIKRLEEILRRREEILTWYRQEMAGYPGWMLNPAKPWAKPVNWQVCLCAEPGWSADLDAFRLHMGRLGVEIRPGFVSLYDQPALNGLARRHGGRVSRSLAGRMVMFPSGFDLEREVVARICTEAKAWLS